MTDWQFTYNGYTFGLDQPTAVIQVEGLDMANLRTSDSVRPSTHGMFPGRDLLGGRSIVFDLEAEGDDAEDLRAEVQLAGAAFVVQDTEQPLTFQIPGSDTLRIYCRPRRHKVPLNQAYSFGLVETAVEFFATDPRIYSDTESTGTVGFPAGGDGVEFDLTFPLVFGVSGTSGIVDAVNAGTFPTPWVASITGPWTNPTIQAGDDVLSFDITLGGGDVLTVSSLARSVILNGTAARNDTVRPGSKWFDLPPGTTGVRFGGASGSGSAELAWRSAWLVP